MQLWPHVKVTAQCLETCVKETRTKVDHSLRSSSELEPDVRAARKVINVDSANDLIYLSDVSVGSASELSEVEWGFRVGQSCEARYKFREVSLSRHNYCTGYNCTLLTSSRSELFVRSTDLCLSHALPLYSKLRQITSRNIIDKFPQ